ncbi:MAG: ATP-dependent DNA helicase [Halobacteria archaeon]|nr:ATP-dependent DNA helicase [Halobacteria archaeon]
MIDPNDQQEKLIESTEGIHVVDAGAGTGKTFAVTRRYANILESKPVEPDDLLLLTFTNNAADEMKERIIRRCEYDAPSLREAPISTFHSLCNRILQRHGFDSPRLLGIDNSLSPSTRVIENELIEGQEFRRFYHRYIDENPEYEDYHRVVSNPGEVLGLIKSLASKGIIPTDSGWYRNSEEYLDGNFDEFRELFDEANKPRNDGNSQSLLRKKLNGYDKKNFLPDAPEKGEIRESGPDKQISKSYAGEAFYDDRDELKDFVHDIYLSYIEYALDRNYLNYSFLQIFAYALLCEDHSLRDELRYSYVMIDEFQDTSEIQFKLALLLSQKDNLCVVGDWKQSIFSFQYASVENITRFEDRLRRYRDELNEDYQRVDYPVDSVNTISLIENYRSSQEILDFSKQSLTLRGSKRERIEEDVLSDFTELNAKNDSEHTSIESFTSSSEKESVLTKIQEIVDNDDYLLEFEEDGETVERTPEYGDIAVLTRTREFGRKLYRKARNHDIPVSYEGPIQLFRTNPGIILLAWLRVLHDRSSERGWSVILENAGYTLDEVNHILEKGEYPSAMIEFRQELDQLRDPSAVARKVFSRYGICDGFSDGIINVLQSTFNNTYMNTGELVDFITASIREGETYEVDNSLDENAVTVQTIHAAKGLEYPIVFIADINNNRFPSRVSNSSNITYEDPMGIRQKKLYSDGPDTPAYLYDNWRTEIINKCLGNDYDEERRLMYVAMTRAKRYLFFSADSENSSRFFRELETETEPKELSPDIRESRHTESEREVLDIEEIPERSYMKMSLHSIMERVETSVDGEGTEYGSKVHEFAEDYALGEDVKPENPDEENVRRLIDSLEGGLIVEETAFLPLDIGDDHRQVTLEGVVDLIHVSEEESSVDIIDYKTDRSREAESEYRKQLSAYYNVLNEVFDSSEVSTYIFYTHMDELVEVDPMSKKELADVVGRKLESW